MAKNKSEAAARSSLRRRRRVRQLIGAGVCVLVVIGLISTISGSVKFVERMFDDTEEKKLFEARLDVLVGLDPLPFDTIADANMNTLLASAVWATLSGNNSDDYEHDEVGAMYMPTADIDKTVEALYGPDVKFNYATFEDHNLTYNYVPEKQAYLMPITSTPAEYKPVVEKIKREGNIKRVTVGYDSPFDTIDASVKYNDYLFTKGEDGVYYLTAIVASATKAEVSVSSSAAAGGANSMPLEGGLLGDTADELQNDARAASMAAAEAQAADAQAADAASAEPVADSSGETADSSSAAS